MCLPTTQRLCESAFTYDLDGDGTVGGYIKYDQVNHSRGIKSCIGAVEYTDNDSPEGLESITNDQPPMTNKIIKDGQLLIVHNNKTYDLFGRVIQ